MRWVYVLRVYVQKLAPLLHYYITDWMFHCLGVFDSFQRTFCDIWVDFMRLYNNLLWYSYLEIFLLILTWTSPSHINTRVSFSNWMLSVLWKVGPTADPVYVSLHNNITPSYLQLTFFTSTALQVKYERFLITWADMFVQHVPVLQLHVFCETEFQRHFFSLSLWISNFILWNCVYKLACSFSMYQYFRALVKFKAAFIVYHSENQTFYFGNALINWKKKHL